MAEKKLQYDFILTGKSARKCIRNYQKKAKRMGQLESPLGIIKMSRQERKALAKTLKVPFQPRYNGPVYLLEKELIKNDKGYLKPAIKNIKQIY